MPVQVINQYHKSHNTHVPYPMMHHSERKWAHFCSEWCIVGSVTGEVWDVWIRSIVHHRVRYIYSNRIVLFQVDCFNINTRCYQYRDSHYNNKMVSQQSYFYNRNLHTWSLTLYRCSSVNCLLCKYHFVEIIDQWMMLKISACPIWNLFVICSKYLLGHFLQYGFFLKKVFNKHVNLAA